MIQRPCFLFRIFCEYFYSSKLRGQNVPVRSQSFVNFKVESLWFALSWEKLQELVENHTAILEGSWSHSKSLATAVNYDLTFASAPLSASLSTSISFGVIQIPQSKGQRRRKGQRKVQRPFPFFSNHLQRPKEESTLLSLCPLKHCIQLSSPHPQASCLVLLQKSSSGILPQFLPWRFQVVSHGPDLERWPAGDWLFLNHANYICSRVSKNGGKVMRPILPTAAWLTEGWDGLWLVKGVACLHIGRRKVLVPPTWIRHEVSQDTEWSQSPADTSGSRCGRCRWHRTMASARDTGMPGAHPLLVRLASALTLGEPMGNNTNKSCQLRPFFFFFFLPPCEICGILAPQPSTEPRSLAVKVWSPNH